MEAQSNDTLSPAAATTERYRRAVEACDVEGVLATAADDVVVHSPISMRADFHGHDELRALARAVFETVTDVRYHSDVGDEQARALFYIGRIGRQPVEEATLVRLDEDAKICEITLFFRPLPGLTKLMATLGPRIGREHGRWRAPLIRVLAAPLALASRAGDRLGVRLAKPGGRRRG